MADRTHEELAREIAEEFRRAGKSPRRREVIQRVRERAPGLGIAGWIMIIRIVLTLLLSWGVAMAADGE